MPHSLKCFIHLQAHSVNKGDEHAAYTSDGLWQSLHLLLQLVAFKVKATSYEKCTLIYAADVVEAFVTNQMQVDDEFCTCRQ